MALSLASSVKRGILRPEYTCLVSEEVVPQKSGSSRNHSGYGFPTAYGHDETAHPPRQMDLRPGTRHTTAPTAPAGSLGLDHVLKTEDRRASADDADDDLLIYTLGGPDARYFRISRNNGQLRTRAPLNYEVKNTYAVVVTVPTRRALRTAKRHGRGRSRRNKVRGQMRLTTSHKGIKCVSENRRRVGSLGN